MPVKTFYLTREASGSRTHRRPLLIAALVLAAASSGCASHSSRGALPPLPVADTWPSDGGPDLATGQYAAGLSWRQYFVEPDLQRAIGIALENNRDLRQALLRVEESRALYQIQRSDQFPGIGIGAQGVRARVPGDLNASGSSVVSGDYEAYVGLSTWELDLWGRVRSLKEAALQNYLATDAAQRAVRSALIGQVANAWLSLRETDERVALAQQTLASRTESYRIFRRRYEVGSASKLELTQVETLLIQARALTAQLQQLRASQAHALRLLLGSADELPAGNDDRLRDEAVFSELSAGLPSELLIARPDIVAAEHQLRASHANISAARAAFLPRIALTGSWGTASAELDGLFDSGSRAWTFVPTLSLPIFDGGRRRANLDLAEVRSDIAVANFEKTIQVAFRDVADALSARQWLAEQVSILRESVDVQTERARLAQLRYDSGAATYLEVLDAQRNLLDAQQQLVQLRRALLSSRVALYAALGGGAADPASPTPIAENSR